jgi:alpha-lytic protease prodomain-containing protein
MFRSWLLHGVSWRHTLLGMLAVGVSSIWFVAATATTFAAPVLSFTGLSVDQIQQVDRIVQADQDDFSGMQLDAGTHVATVYLTASRQGSAATAHRMSVMRGLATAHAAQRRGASASWSVAYASARHSGRELSQVMSRLTAKQLPAGVPVGDVTKWYVEPATNSVHVGLRSLAASDVQAFQRTFGDLVQFEMAAPLQVAVSGRLVDGPPWFGGDRLEQLQSDGTALECTSGFAAVDTRNNDPGMLTAGHCFGNVNNNFSVDQGYIDSSNVLNIAGNIGMVTIIADARNGNGDLEFIDNTFSTTGSTGVSSTEYTNPPNPPTNASDSTARVVALGLNGDNAAFCSDGSFTGENCSGKVIPGQGSANVCVMANEGFNMCHLDCGQSTNGTRLSQPGDSGGPVYGQDPSGHLDAMGLISVDNSSGTQVCYTDMSWVVSNNPVALITG